MADVLVGRGFSLDEVLGLTMAQVSEFYSRALAARVNYMNDVRMGVWAESKDLNSYYRRIARG